MRAIITIILIIVSGTISAQKRGQLLIDSLTTALHHVKDDTARIGIWDRLSYIYADINPDSGMLMGQQALALATKINWQHGIAVACSDIGVNYKAKSDLAKALEYQQKALGIYEQLGEKRSIGAMLQNIALVYHAKGNYTKALEYNLRALNLFEERGDQRSIAITRENIGTLYLEQKNYEKTIEYYTAAITINKTLGDNEALARNMGNMGIVLNDKGDYGKALEHHLSALDINRKTGNKNATQINLANVGLTYLRMEQYPQAIHYNLQALKISEEMGSKNSIAINAGNTGEIYFSIAKKMTEQNRTAGAKENIRQSIHYLEWAVRLCKETGFAGPLTEFVPYLSEAYAISGNYKKAYEYHKEYVQVKDSFFSLQSAEQMANLENKWKADLKEKEILLKEKQIQLAKLEIKQRKNQYALFILGICLLVIVLGLAVKSIVNYQKSNKLLAIEKTRQRDLILNQDRDIQLRNRVLEEIAHTQSHDIRGHVATILGLAHLFNKEDHTDPINQTIVDGMNTSAEKLDEIIKAVVKKENDLKRNASES